MAVNGWRGIGGRHLCHRRRVLCLGNGNFVWHVTSGLFWAILFYLREKLTQSVVRLTKVLSDVGGVPSTLIAARSSKFANNLPNNHSCGGELSQQRQDFFLDCAGDARAAFLDVDIHFAADAEFR